MDKERVYLASDHAGFELKQAVKSRLLEEGFQVSDSGPESYDRSDDYPEYVLDAASNVAEDEDSLGIVIGYSGQGEAIAANKVEGIRAAVYYGSEEDILTLSKKHNDANVLSLGANFLDHSKASDDVIEWVKTSFSNKERHRRRISEIRSFETREDPQIIPSILAEDQETLDREIDKVIRFSDTFHIDVEDGSFVEGRSMDFKFNLPDYQDFEAHLMVEDPVGWINEKSDPFSRINFHVEPVNNPEKVIQRIKSEDKQVGVAIKPDTGTGALEEFVHDIDVIQIMTVEPGDYGKDFVEEMVSRVKSVRKAFPETTIEVDGHVRPGNIEDLRNAGADLFVSGSYLQENDNSGQAVRRLQEKI